MRRFLFGRLIFSIVSIVAATFIVLLLSRMSGDPILLYANSGYGLTKEGEEAIRKRLGLDKPILI